MTADELALLRGVEAAPDDDLPRLVYADWLDEHGRPARAEFIRVQCELASIERRLPGMTAEEKRVEGPRRGELVNAEREMWQTQRFECIGPQPWLFRQLTSCKSPYSTLVARGFLSEFSIGHLAYDTSDFVEFCVNLIPRPHIVFCNIHSTLISDDPSEAFRRESIWRELNAVEMHDGHDRVLLPHELIPMMGPRYSALGSFTARASGLNPGHVCVIAERLRAPRLDRIDLAGNEIVDSGVAFLHRAVYARSLRTIDLSQNPICRPEISKLTKDRFPSLQKLDLTDCPIMPQSLAQLRAQLPGVEVIC